MKILVVVDMQNDFIDGALGTKEAVSIVPHVVEKIRQFDGRVLYTRDTHEENYLETQEGRNLPVPHCIRGTKGWELAPQIEAIRVEKAGEYLLSHPQAKVIVTGGQGADEPCPESLTQRNALVAQGVEEDRIFQEDRSHNTRQNLEYAMDIAQEEGLGTEFVVVTQEFHMFRALQLAETAGFTAYSLTAQSDPLLLPEYYGRELLSLTKWMVERQFLG